MRTRSFNRLPVSGPIPAAMLFHEPRAFGANTLFTARRILRFFAAVAGFTLLSVTLSAQSVVTITDLGANAPVPGLNDISQLSTSGQAGSPDGLNYYTDNYPSHSGGVPGQTFKTGPNAGGYWLDTLALKTGGGSAQSTTVPQTYVLYIFAVSNGIAMPYFSETANDIAFNNGDWLEWTNLNLLLSANMSYAYGFSRTSSGTGWVQLANDGNNPYDGGQIALLPVGGGPIAYGASGQFDGVFDLGLGLTNPAGPPVLPALSISGATGVEPNDANLNGQVLSPGNEVPVVTIYYGTADGGTNPSAWANRVSLGLQNGAFSTPIFNLNPDTQYYFTASASNQAGAVWAKPSLSFKTATPSPILNLAANWGVWQGWGCSLCWWANVFGTRTDLANIVFTTNYVTLNGVNLPGLGLNIARYNAGGCSANSINGQSMVASPNIPGWKQMQGFWLNPASADPGTTNWDWNADTNQRAMMLMAQARGASIQLFSNSPMWWMLDNFNPSGPTTASTDNLQPAYNDDAAIYLATIAAYARTNWGVTFNSIEAFNEPHGSWWTANGKQEGCYFDTVTQATVIQYLRQEMNNRGLTNMPIAASDENSYNVALSTWQGFGSTVQGDVGIVTTHGYSYGSGNRSGLYAAVGGKTLWNSEYGENDGTGLSLAANLDLDFSSLHPTAWCYWQPFDGGGWGLIQSDVGSSNIGAPNPKYYVLAQYTRHIRPGMTVLDSLAGNTVAAYSVTNRTLVLVTCNLGPAQTISFCLTNVPYVAGPVSRWITVPNSGTEYAQSNDVALANNSFQVTFPANSIQTFQIANVDLGPPADPVSLVARAGAGFVNLDWTPSAGATNYVVKRATSFAGPFSILTESAATIYTDGQVTDGVNYYYTVTPVNGAGSGPASNPASATPYGSPALTGTFARGQLLLSWPAWASNYSIYYATNLAHPVIWLLLTNQPVSVNGNQSIVFPTTNGAARFYRLKADE